MADHVNASLNRILRSGEYVCRPQRQIFVEHTFTNSKGQVTRQVTKADLDGIAATGNANALNTGDLAPIGFGHTFDDILDDKGQLVRKFAEAEQPKPIGYLHNYYVAQRGDGKWALYADEWIQKVITDERGQPVDGIKYAETFPRRSAEYFPGKKWIDWLALLRRTPALNMGLDIYAYANLHPDKVHYCHDGASLAFGAVVDSRGKWRYAHEEESMPDFPKPKEAPSTPPGPQASVANATQNFSPPPAPAVPTAPAAAPPGSPAAPADDRPPLPAAGTDDPMASPLHQQAAERYMAHCTGMHHSQVKGLLHHAHAMYSAQLGLPGDKMAEHVPPPPVAAPPAGAAPAPAVPPPGPAAPAAVAPATPPGPEHQKNSPVGLSGDSSWQKPEHEKHNAPVAGPGVGPAFIPGEEHKRMSAVQQGIEQHRTEAEKDRYELQQLRDSVASMQMDSRKARYERDLTALMGMGFEFTLSKEVERMAPVRYDEAACAAHLACIKENYQRAPVNDGYGFIQTADAPAGVNGAPEKKVTYEEKTKATKYCANHPGTTFDEALGKIRGV